MTRIVATATPSLRKVSVGLGGIDALTEKYWLAQLLVQLEELREDEDS